MAPVNKRLLAQRSEFGYTDRPELAVPWEPEAITEEEQNVISLRARTEFAEVRQDENRRRDNQQWMERLKKAEQAAESKGVNIFRCQAAIRREILNIENLIQGRGTLVSA
jgi:hypothetical protein